MYTAQLPDGTPLPNTVFSPTEFNMQTGDYVWRFTYDLFYESEQTRKAFGRLPQPEVLRPLLNELADVGVK